MQRIVASLTALQALCALAGDNKKVVSALKKLLGTPATDVTNASAGMPLGVAARVLTLLRVRTRLARCDV